MRHIIAFMCILLFQHICYAEEVPQVEAEPIVATQQIEMTANKVIVNVLKQPLNENSQQVIIMKKNWFVVNIGVNGKVKVNPLTHTYEVE